MHSALPPRLLVDDTHAYIPMDCKGSNAASAPGKLVDLDDTIKGFDAICKGEYDHLPEAAFYMVGGIEEVLEKAEKLSKDNK